MHDPKPRPNKLRYYDILASMTPEQKLDKVFELGEMGRDLLRIGVRQRNPNASEEEIDRMVVERLSACHNSSC